MPTEQWLPIADFPAYQVSNLGRVRSVDRTVTFAQANYTRTVFIRGKLLKATEGSNGYLQVSLSQDGEVICARIHVLVAEAFIGPRPEGLNVLHRDGDKSNCAVGNLYHGTQSQNAEDARRHGTLCAGERHGAAKLTEHQVRVIRSTFCNYGVIASQFGVSKSNVGQIKRGETWAGVL